MMLNLFKNNEKDKITLISKINLKSAQVNKLKGITEKGFREIINLNTNLKLIQNIEYSEKNMQILTRIERYFDELVSKNNANLIPLYASRMIQFIEKMFINKLEYHEVDENNEDKILNAEVLLEETAGEVEKTEQEMNEITNENIKNNISRGSVRYVQSISKFNSLQSKLNWLDDRINKAIEILDMNSKATEMLIKRKNILFSKTLLTMSGEDYFELKKNTQDLQDEYDRNKAMFTQAIDQPVPTLTRPRYSVDDSLFQKAVEKTLLEQIAEKNPETYIEKINELPVETLFNGIAELNKKMEELAISMDYNRTKDKEELLSEMKRLMTVAYDEHYLLKETHGDLKKIVTHFLNMKPIELQAPSLKIRSCIENWFRYEKGIDLNNKFYFKNAKVEDKMRAAGISEKLIKDLVPMYTATNPYIHDQVERTLEISDAERANQLLEAADYLSDLNFTKVDYKQGIPTLYKKEDELLKEYIDQNKDAFAKPNSQIEKNCHMWFNNQETRKTFMKQQHIDIPTVHFNTRDDLRTTIQSTITGTTPQIAVMVESPYGERKKGTIERFVDGRYGTIKDENNQEYHVKLRYFRDFINDKSILKPGVKVEFTTALGERGLDATDVKIVALVED